MTEPPVIESPFVSESNLIDELRAVGLLNGAVEAAVSVAKRAHENQTRDDGSPYLEEHVFPVAVETAKYIANSSALGSPEHAVVVALLHDVLEDAPSGTAVDLEASFGREVSTIVELLTKEEPAGPNDQSDGNAREERYMYRVAAGPFLAKLVKVFDRLNNLACIHKSSVQKRVGYVEETRRYHLPLASGIDPALAEAMEARLQDLAEFDSG